MGGGEAPQPADPMTTANQAAKVNRKTAITQYELGATDQVTPHGTLRYRQTGTWADGTPKFEAVTALTPEQQRLFDTGQQTQQNIAEIGRDQSGRIGRLLATPVKLDNEAAEGRLWELGRKRLDPMFTERRAALETDLFNRGVRPGSEAYDQAMRQFDEGRNDAYNNLALTGRGQAIQELLTERNQPINEITALLGTSQITPPTFQQTPQPGVAAVDYAGLVAQQDAARQAAYQQQQARQSAMLGGLFGTGAAVMGGWARGGFGNPLKVS